MAELSKFSTEDGWYRPMQNEWGEPEQSDGWSRVEEASHGYSPSFGGEDESDDQVSISSLSEPEDRPAFFGPERPEEGEDAETDLAAQIVGQGLAEDLEPRITDVVFKHNFSGCCHIAKLDNFDPCDGESVVLRCGKIATKIFERIARAGNFFPYKCSRCFTDD